MRLSGWVFAGLVAILSGGGEYSAVVQARSTTDSIPQIANYQFLQDPKIHRYSPHKGHSDGHLAKRSFHEELDLHHMIDDDTFHIEINAYNTSYSIVVEPNVDLVHPEAQIARRLSDGTLVKEALVSDDIGIYRGYVLRTGPVEPLDWSPSLQKWALFKSNQYTFDENQSWARFSVYRDPDSGDRAVLDGMFRVDGETFYIKPSTVYSRTKRDSDPQLSNPYARAESERYANSIIYRNTDFIKDNTSGRGTRKRSLSESGQTQTCGSDRLLSIHRPDTVHTIEPGNPFYPYRTKADRQMVGFGKGGGLSLFKRDNGTSGNSFDGNQAALDAGCLNTRKVMYMGAAADCSYVSHYSTQDKARKQILTDWNQASSVYERQFNVMLGLIELHMEDVTCPDTVGSVRWNRGCSEGYRIEDRLSDFSAWRAEKGSDGTGLWHLMTDCPTGTEVGLAWLGTVCETGSRSGVGGTVSSGTGVSAISRDEWKVVAHEIGHNFGASHDCTSRECPCSGDACGDCCPCTDGCDCNGKFIMNPTSPVSTDDFSPCSISNICRTIKSSAVKCLQDPGKRKTLGTAMCGNGIKEGDEECDCGTSDSCKNDPCCDGETCKLRPNAECSDSNDLCCVKCKIRTKGSVCRPKYSECDIEEICDGESPDCPEDSHVEDGKSCGNGTESGLKCASGQCTSRDAQCRARGAHDGLIQRCKISVGGDPCDLQCSDPKSPGFCVFMSGSFMDGTECGFHAHCRSGKCKGNNWFYQFLLLFQRNLAVSIPIAIVVGLLIIGCVLSCLCRCCGISFCGFGARRRAAKNVSAYSNTVPPAYTNNAIYGQPQYPQPMYQPPPPPPSGWVDPGPYNGPSHMQSLYGQERRYLDGNNESYQMNEFGTNYPDSRPQTRLTRNVRSPSNASTLMGSGPQNVVDTRTSDLGLLHSENANGHGSMFRR